VLDHTDRDFVNFGIGFLSDIAAWFMNVESPNSEEPIKGVLYVSNNIRIDTERN